MDDVPPRDPAADRARERVRHIGRGVERAGPVLRPTGRLSSIVFTSGSTGQPKGVMKGPGQHDHIINTIGAIFGEGAVVRIGIVLAGSVAASVQLTVADLKNQKTDEANYNARPLEQILIAFRAARERLLKRVDELDPPLFARTIPHPRLKTPMRLVDHLYFVAEHDDHHLARIWELVNVVR